MRYAPTSSGLRHFTPLTVAFAVGLATSMFAVACASEDPQADADSDTLTSGSGSTSASTTQTGSNPTTGSSDSGTGTTSATGSSTSTATQTSTAASNTSSSTGSAPSSGGMGGSGGMGAGGSSGGMGGGTSDAASAGGAGGMAATDDGMGAGGDQNSSDDDIDIADDGVTDDTESEGAGGASPMEGGEGGAGGQDGGDVEPNMNDDGPCPIDDVCKILPLGDSITDGIGASGGYRVELFQHALDAGKNITFVGGSSNGPAMVGGQPFPQQHEGHSGWTVEQIDNIVPSPALEVDPHIILLHIGTNDMYQTPAGAADRLAKLIDEIVADNPEALLVVSTIIPFPGASNEVSNYNAALEQVVNERIDAGDFVLLVDQFTGFPTGELGDGVHPNAAGYARMAGVWWAAIEPYLP